MAFTPLIWSFLGQRQNVGQQAAFPIAGILVRARVSPRGLRAFPFWNIDSATWLLSSLFFETKILTVSGCAPRARKQTEEKSTRDGE